MVCKGIIYTAHKIDNIEKDKEGRDRSVGIATRYGMDGPRIESRWGARFSAPVQTGAGAHPTSYTMCTGSFPGVKRPGRGVDHPPPPSAEVKERVELYLPLGLRGLLEDDLYLYLEKDKNVCNTAGLRAPVICTGFSLAGTGVQ